MPRRTRGWCIGVSNLQKSTTGHFFRSVNFSKYLKAHRRPIGPPIAQADFPETEELMKTVLIADGDLGFVFWLGERLSKLGHQALPAKNLAHAVRLAEEFDFHVLVINPALPDAALYVDSLRRSHPGLTVFSLEAQPEARMEQAGELEKALQESPVCGGQLHLIPREGRGDSPELLESRLAPSRAALMGMLFGAAVWTLLIVLVLPR
jgi:hypothetical protein